MRRPPRISYLAVAGAMLIVMAAPGLGGATTTDSGWSGAVQGWTDPPRAETPEDRYALAGGCYAARTAGGSYLVRTDSGYAATAGERSEAEPFHFQATDLGTYLLFDSTEHHLAASEGVIGEAAYAVTRSTPGQTAGGVVMEETDKAADAAARSDANRAAGRGARVVAAPAPSELADWEIDGVAGDFSIRLPATGQALGEAGGELTLGADPASFAFELVEGCATFPEIEVNVDGSVLGGATSYQETRGYIDAHLHMMAYEFIGGRVRCGRPWHRFGAPRALVDCPDHEPGGHGALLEAILSGGNPITGHNTDGWPSFEGWPKPGSLTHEQVYYKWLERAWRGGLRLFVNLLVDNGQLCNAYPFKRNSCNEMDGVRLQAQRIEELERYIDAQSGGPGEGWFRIVTDPFEARSVINEGKLAVVLGIEISVLFDCGLTRDQPRCDKDDVEAGLNEVYKLGVRQMELVNKFDNALSGVTGDAGFNGPVVNLGNFGETQQFWRFETCGEHPDDLEGAQDKPQLNIHDDSPLPKELTERDSIFGGVLQVAGRSGAAPVYPQTPHCNVLGLSELGRATLRGMVERGMIVDPDHMSARARTQALDYLESDVDVKVHGLPYSGIVSSHSWADDTIYPRVHELGGVVTPHAGGSAGFVKDWTDQRGWADDRYFFAVGFGSDVNGFSRQGGPRGADVPNPVTYPFEGFGGVTIQQQRSGTRTYDINGDGVAHYGLYPDWIEDLRRQAGDQIVEDLARSSEAYLQMWERAIGIPPDACRPDVDDLRPEDFDALREGMAPEDVLWTLGQPSTRMGGVFTYCVAGGRTATLTFTPDGSLTRWDLGDSTVIALDANNPSAGQVTDRVSFAATLTDESGTPLVDETVTFSVGAASASGTTDEGGRAVVTVTLQGPPGDPGVIAEFGGASGRAAAIDSAPFTVEQEVTVLALFDAIADKSSPAIARAILRDDDGQALAGFEISLFVEDKVKGETTLTLIGSGTTGPDGLVSFEIPKRYVSKSPRPMEARFEGTVDFTASQADAAVYRS